MLWRPSYETRIRHNIALPEIQARALDGQAAAPVGDAALPDGALLGAFDPRAAAELGVWRRLLDEAGHPAFTLFARAAWTPRDRRALALATAPSLQPWTRLVDDPEGAWHALIEPDRPERSFAAVVRGGVAEVLMVGLPTEEAWDEFRDALRG